MPTFQDKGQESIFYFDTNYNVFFSTHTHKMLRIQYFLLFLVLLI